MHKPSRVETTCAGCGKTISVTGYKYRTNKRNFCSRECMYKNKAVPHPVFNCDFCGKESTMPWSQYNRSKNHFCSQDCNNKFHNAEKNKTLMTPEVREKLSKATKARYAEGPKKEKPKAPPKPRKAKENITGYRKKGHVDIHRMVAEQILGRPLKKGEVVHHIDGNKTNNDPDNLFIFASNSEHSKYHADLRKGVATVLIGGDAQCSMSQDRTK